ncbi:Gamma-glutamyl phosphate reductase [Dissostichus eleginoides]|uniref:Gamma-glutamyl phosphate reductase n=1 Tax=Dissostichus eleginoides TaxID=100907 RepID=A0AAD9BPE7_DISEL|nr:Gamma-glutamyl phosphate reductase [Dissostichus eleginoides]
MCTDTFGSICFSGDSQTTRDGSEPIRGDQAHCGRYYRFYGILAPISAPIPAGNRRSIKTITRITGSDVMETQNYVFVIQHLVL